MSRKLKDPFNGLLRLFLFSKLIIFVLAHISVLLIQENNSAGDLIISLSQNSRNSNTFDQLVKMFVKPFIRWDAVHFLAIAKNGYVFENQFAFFPLLPMFSRLIANYCGLKRFISIEPLMALIGIVFSNFCHYFATVFLYKLTLLIFKSKRFARISSLLFIFNAASIQLSAMYTEAPFALFTFAGLYAFYSRRKFVASLFWALASATRSNGIVLIGFFVYDFLMILSNGRFYIRKIIKEALSTFIYSLISISSFIAFQYYGYLIYCKGSDSARPWCHYPGLPNIYSFVQGEYWNVGILNYYTVNNIPNFLFASPMIIICTAAFFKYCAADPLRFVGVGVIRQHPKNKDQAGFYNDHLLPHIFLLGFMLSYNGVFAHVQIITRVFTFVPVLYWFMAHLIINSTSRIKNILMSYIGIYALLGTILFSLNYPPA